MLPNDRLTLLPSPSWKSAISTRLRELRQARASFGHVAWAWEVRESGSEQLAADNPPVPGSISSIGSPTIASAYRQRARRRLIVVIARAGRPLWPHCISGMDPSVRIGDPIKGALGPTNIGQSDTGRSAARARQQSNTYQHHSGRNRWSSSTSSRISLGSCAPCHWHSRQPADPTERLS